MIVSYRESIEIDPERKADIFAYAGVLQVFKHGMTMRDAVKAIMAVRGTSWYQDLCMTYPVNDEYLPRKRTPRKAKSAAPKPDGKPATQTAGKGTATAKSA